MADTKKFKTGMGIGKKIGLGIGIAFGIFIAIGITGSLLSNDSNSVPNSSSNAPTQGSSQIQEKITPKKIIPLGEKSNPAKMGDTVVTENIEYQVTKVSKADSIGNALLGDKAEGIFIIVDLAIENKGKESVDIISNYFTLIDSQGRKFDPDNEAWIYLKKEIAYKKLQPSLPTTGQIIFDGPRHEETYVLEISGGAFSFDKKYVILDKPITNTVEGFRDSEPERPIGAGQLGDAHVHASLLVRIFGDKFDFSLPAYQIKSSWIHFEAQDGSTIHRHSKGVTLGYLFDTLRIGLTDECFIFPDGREFCTNEDYSLKFYVNDNPVSSITDLVFQDDDRILISYGNETPAQIEKQLQELNSQMILK